MINSQTHSVLSEDTNFVQREERSSARTIVNLKFKVFTHSHLNLGSGWPTLPTPLSALALSNQLIFCAMRFTDQPGLDAVAARAACGDHPVDLEDADCPAALRAMAGPTSRAGVTYVRNERARSVECGHRQGGARQQHQQLHHDKNVDHEQQRAQSRAQQGPDRH